MSASMTVQRTTSVQEAPWRARIAPTFSIVWRVSGPMPPGASWSVPGRLPIWPERKSSSPTRTASEKGRARPSSGGMGVRSIRAGPAAAQPAKRRPAATTHPTRRRPPGRGWAPRSGNPFDLHQQLLAADVGAQVDRRQVGAQPPLERGPNLAGVGGVADVDANGGELVARIEQVLEVAQRLFELPRHVARVQAAVPHDAGGAREQQAAPRHAGGA